MTSKDTYVILQQHAKKYMFVSTNKTVARRRRHSFKFQMLFSKTFIQAIQLDSSLQTISNCLVFFLFTWQLALSVYVLPRYTTSGTMMTLFVRLLIPYLIFLLITLPLGNQILFTIQHQNNQDAQMWRLSTEVESTAQLQAMGRFTLILRYELCSFLQTQL